MTHTASHLLDVTSIILANTGQGALDSSKRLCMVKSYSATCSIQLASASGITCNVEHLRGSLAHYHVRCLLSYTLQFL